MTDIEKLRELLAATEGLKNLQVKTYPEGDAGPRDRWIEAESIARVYNAADYVDESDAALIVAAVNALPNLLDEIDALRAERDQILDAVVKKLQCPEIVLINMLRGTIVRPSAGALPKLYSIEELVDAVRFAAAYNGGYDD